MKKTVFLLFVSMLFFASCRKPVDGFVNPGFETVPTLNAVLTEGQPVWAHVSLARPLDSVHSLPCPDATVLFYVNGKFAEQLAYDDESGFYQGTTLVESSNEYACKVVVPGFDTLSAFTEVPERTIVRSVQVIANALLDEEGYPCPAVLITFTTDPEKKTILYGQH